MVFGTRTDAFSAVPQEILLHILQNLPQSDILQVRLTASFLNQAASETLFSNITLRDDDRSRSRLVKISDSPFWSRQVRSVVWGSFIDLFIVAIEKGPVGELGFKLIMEYYDPRNIVSSLPNLRSVHFAVDYGYLVGGFDLQCQLWFFGPSMGVKIHTTILEIDHESTHIVYKADPPFKDFNINLHSIHHNSKRCDVLLLRHLRTSIRPALKRVKLAGTEIYSKHLITLLSRGQWLEVVTLEHVSVKKLRGEYDLPHLIKAIGGRKSRTDWSPVKLNIKNLSLVG